MLLCILLHFSYVDFQAVRQSTLFLFSQPHDVLLQPRLIASYDIVKHLGFLFPKKRLIMYSINIYIQTHQGFPGGSMVKNLPANARETGQIPGWGKIPWRRKWLPTPGFLPGKSHGQRSLASPWGYEESDMTQ